MLQHVQKVKHPSETVPCTVSCFVLFFNHKLAHAFTPVLNFSSLTSPIDVFHKESPPPFPILHFTSPHSTSLRFVHFASLYFTSLPFTSDNFSLHLRLFTSLHQTRFSTLFDDFQHTLLAFSSAQLSLSFPSF